MRKKLKVIVILIFIMWTAIITVSIGQGIVRLKKETRKLAYQKAQEIFNKDYSFRKWVTQHGGVYVPATEKTPPSPYLKGMVKDQNIETPNGKELTLINPAYAVRQLMKNYENEYGIKGKITSLNYLNPLNAPAPWEKEVLQNFEKNAKEFVEFVKIDNEEYIHYVKPLYISTGCLACHAYQGYMVGDLRGGISVSFSLANSKVIEKENWMKLVYNQIFIWLIGLALISYGYYKIRNDILLKEKADEVIKTNLQEKEILIKEIHHRVKNNLQMMSSLIKLQLLENHNNELIQKSVMEKTLNRIETISDIHEALYQHSDLKEIDFGKHVEHILTNLLNIYSEQKKKITASIQCKDIFFNINIAVPLGLLVNEILTNTLKHAFPNNRSGEIKIVLEKTEATVYQLIIEDNGIGISNLEDLENAATLGFSLINSLAKQLNSKIKLYTKQGTKYTIQFEL
ncbi:MAG: DUF3365 domain-containing protein [Spirochaetes bacterium]|nr:DUF3365 domain-containing protein [Spirochaetota bacterium]